MTSLKIKQTLCNMVFIFTLLPVIVTAVTGFFSMTGFASESLGQYARSVGKAQAEVLDQCIANYENRLELVSADERVKAFVNTGMGSEEETSFLSSLFDSVLSEEYDIKNIDLIKSDGTVILDHSGIQSPGQYFYGFDEKMEKLAFGQTYISSVMTKNELFEQEVLFLARSVQNDGGERIGYVALTVGTSKLGSLLAATEYGQGHGYLVLSDGSDTVLNFEGVPSQKISTLANVDMRGILTSGANESGTVFDYETGGLLGSYGFITGVANTSWKWVSIYPGDMAMSQIFMPIIISMSIMLACAVICVVVGQLAARAVVSPINRMVKKIREIQMSRYSTRLDIDVWGEYDRIADLFNGMLDEVCMSEELHKTVSDISDNMLFEWDFAKDEMYFSENFKETFALDADKARFEEGLFLDRLMPEEYAETFNKDIASLLKNRNGSSGEYQIKNRDGVTLWFAIRILCVTDRLGEPLRVIGVVTDIDNEKKLELQLSVRASYDFLSQLYNRSTFEREFQSEMERNAQSKVCLIFVDVDDFKFINDRYGHSVGDEVIKFVSGLLKKRVENSGFAGRFGGDEFVLCITDQEMIENVENMAMNLIDELYGGYNSEMAGVRINVKASIGIAIAPDHGNSSQSLIAAADEAMYFVKKNGKANYHVYRPEDSDIEDLQHTL